MYKIHNVLTNEDIVLPRLVNQQTLDFNDFCEYLADGSTITPADVSAVMKQIEMRLPLILGLNSKVVCSPEGLTFRPKVSGSLTQSQLKAKLEAKLAADPTLDIDVNRAVTLSDLTISDLIASIAIDMPKKWDSRFKSKAQFKRVTKSIVDGTESSEYDESTDSTDASDSTGTNTNTGSGTNTGSTDNTGDGNTGDGGVPDVNDGFDMG